MESGWNVWVWLVGSGWNVWVWLVGVVVRRYIDFLIVLIPTLVSVLFPYFLFFSSYVHVNGYKNDEYNSHLIAMIIINSQLITG